MEKKRSLDFMQLMKHSFIQRGLIIALILLFVSSCKTTEKLIRQGNLIKAQEICNNAIGVRRRDCLAKIGHAYLNKGEIEKAAKFFDEANNLYGLNEVAEIFYAKNDYENFSKYGLFARRQEHFFDDFSCDLNKWTLLTKNLAKVTFTAGKLLFSNFDKNYVKLIYPSQFSFDLNKNFIIRTTFRRTDTIKNVVAIAWGLDDISTYCIFGINESGEYLYAKHKKNKWVNMINFTKSQAIHKGNAESNALTLIKSGNKVIFSINDIYVDESIFDPSKGNKIGFFIDPEVGVELLDFRVYTIPPLSDFYQQKARQALDDVKYDCAIYLLSKIEDKNHLLSLAQARFNNDDFLTMNKSLDAMHISPRAKNIVLGEFYLTKPESEKAWEFYNLAGFSATSDLVETVYNEDFIDNRNEWGLGKNEYRDSKIENGNLILEYFGDTSYVYTTSTPDLDYDIDFLVECVMKKLDGKNNQAMEIIWGYKDIHNYHTFGTDNQGKYILSESLNNEWRIKVNWTETPYYHKDENNTLIVLKDSSIIRCFINGHQVCDYPFKNLKGKKVGFSVGLNDHVTVAIDRLTVKQLAPVSFINLITRHKEMNNSDLQAIANYYLNRFEHMKAIEFAKRCEDNSIIVQSVPCMIEELILKNKPDEALLLCDKYLDTNTSMQSFITVGHYFMSQQKYIEAKEILKKAGHNKEAYLKLAELHKIQGNSAETEKYNKLIGDMFFQEKNYEKALEHYQTANEFLGIEKIINHYVTEKDFQTALTIAKKINNSDLEKHIQIAQGENLMTEKKYEEAIKLFQEIGNDALEKKCYQNLGDDYYKNGLYSKAKKYYKMLGNEKRVKECETKIQSLPVKPGSWNGEHISFSVDDDGKTLSFIQVAFPVRNSDQYSVSMGYDIYINEDKQFHHSFFGGMKVEGFFISSTEAIITFDGIYINGEKGEHKIIANWKE